MFTTPLDQLPTERQQRLARGLCQLEEAFADAEGTGLDVWQFAIRLGELHVAGLTSGDVRWLIARGILLHALEQSGAESDRRAFTPSASLALCEASSLVLAAVAVPHVRGWCARLLRRDPPETSFSGDLPRWDATRRELIRRGLLVKRFRVPAPSQELILNAFQEEGWPSGIDDPLPFDRGADPAQRLHEAVRGLNRNQQNRLIRFERDGRGTGVCWFGMTDGETRVGY